MSLAGGGIPHGYMYIQTWRRNLKKVGIPSNYYANVVNARTKGIHGKLSRLNTLNTRLFDSELFPDSGYQINGNLFTRDWKPVSKAQFYKYIFSKSDRCVFKVDSSNKGLGVEVVDRGNIDAVISKRQDGVFRDLVVADDRLTIFSKKSTPTLRLTTVVETDGSTSLRAAYLRVGRDADSFVKSASHIRIPLDLETGVCAPKAYLPDWMPISTHPDTSVSFEGRVVPGYEKCVAAAVSLHARVPQISCIGWDVIVDDTGKVKFFEWNGEVNDIKFTEALTGPGFLNLGWENLWRG